MTISRPWGIKMNLSDFTKEQIQEARDTIADNHATLSKKIRKQDRYASHVTEEQKEDYLSASLVTAERIRKGLHDNDFWCWQSIVFELTGKSPALLP